MSLTVRKGFHAQVREVVTAVLALVTGYNLMRTAMVNAVLQHGTLLIDATAEKFKTTTTFYWTRLGIQFSKAATGAIVFSAAHVVNSSKFGVILIQINDAGTISTKVPLSPQVYTSAPLALAALPDPDAGNVYMGHIAIAAKAATWTANTDDLTNGSDLTTATFVNATVATLPSAVTA